MVLAFNCVSVAALILEGLRFHNCLPGGLNQSMTQMVKYYSTGFERMNDSLVITQIYLLMGCAFPLCASFILTGGGVMTTTWTLYSLAGVVFLGVGDTVAAIGGRAFGQHKWRQLSNKTTHGTSYCVISTTAMYYILCSVIDQYHLNLFLCYLLAAIAASVIEGCTLQFDNLVCAMAYFALVVMMVALFDNL